jgi:hypothetical protein
MNRKDREPQSKENIEMKKPKPEIFWQNRIEEIGRDHDRQYFC